jgi:hypothetical protein
MENRRRGVISERKMIQLWETSAQIQLEQLLTETWLDDLKSGYESTKSGALKIAKKMSDAAKAAWQKANNMILSLSIQAYQLATKSVRALASTVNKLMTMNAKFKKAHPILHRIVSIIIFMIIIIGIMALFSPAAHAGVATPKGNAMNETQYQALRGLMSRWQDAQGADNIQNILDIGEAIKTLDNAYQTENLELLNQLGDSTQIAYGKLQQTVQHASDGDPVAAEQLKDWIKVGQKMRIQ